jgi:hypothetical protein
MGWDGQRASLLALWGTQKDDLVRFSWTAIHVIDYIICVELEKTSPFLHSCYNLLLFPYSRYWSNRSGFSTRREPLSVQGCSFRTRMDFSLIRCRLRRGTTQANMCDFNHPIRATVSCLGRSRGKSSHAAWKETIGHENFFSSLLFMRACLVDRGSHMRITASWR